jgi:uncharacterized membrane protein (DUF485 family)
MPLITVVLTLVTVGIVLFLLTKYGAQFMDPTILKVVWWLIVVCTIIWLLQLTGIFSYFANVPFPRVR